MRIVKMMLPLLLCLAICRFSIVDGKLAISEEDSELERQLQLINKPPIKSIQTEFGYIVDCVDINKQLAFDHPLLKNHKLQRKPSFLQKKSNTSGHGSACRTLKIGLQKDLCPTGTVPIRRTTKEDLNAAKSLCDTHDFPGSHFAVLYTPRKSGNFYKGVGGILNVYRPRVDFDQMSVAQTLVQNGDFNQLNAILFGWQVAPQLYGASTRTHLFALWTSDNFKKTGCYNIICAGFVQTDQRIYLGSLISPVSSYEGQQYTFPLSISQDPDTKNWWLIVEDTNTSIGYYPAELFSNMAIADLVGWGGRVSGPPNAPGPGMGSGHFPDGNFSHACFFRQIAYNTGSGKGFEGPKSLQSYVDNPKCYDLKYYGYKDDYFGYTFQFGGPGGNCGI